jgi:hypothetical protein
MIENKKILYGGIALIVVSLVFLILTIYYITQYNDVSKKLEISVTDSETLKTQLSDLNKKLQTSVTDSETLKTQLSDLNKKFEVTYTKKIEDELETLKPYTKKIENDLETSNSILVLALLSDITNRVYSNPKNKQFEAGPLLAEVEDDLKPIQSYFKTIQENGQMSKIFSGLGAKSPQEADDIMNKRTEASTGLKISEFRKKYKV